jgi:putative SOS response-associated peptidase YedK
VEPAYYAPIITRAQKLKLADDMMRHLGKPLTMSGEIRPTDVAAVLAPNKEGRVAVFPMLWGFSHEATDAPIVNCRLETASQKEMWKDSWFRRRCVIPCSWYFEWEHFRSPDGKRSKIGDKYLIQPKGSHTTLLAGLYRIEERNGVNCPVFAVITRDATEELRSIHDRMPVILSRDDVESWIKPDGNPMEISQKALIEVVMEKAVR